MDRSHSISSSDVNVEKDVEIDAAEPAEGNVRVADGLKGVEIVPKLSGWGTNAIAALTCSLLVGIWGLWWGRLVICPLYGLRTTAGGVLRTAIVSTCAEKISWASTSWPSSFFWTPIADSENTRAKFLRTNASSTINENTANKVKPENSLSLYLIYSKFRNNRKSKALATKSTPSYQF